MIWTILYVICTIICCGIMFYVYDLSFDDVDTILAISCSIVWPILLVLYVLYGLGHCIKLLLAKIIKTK